MDTFVVAHALDIHFTSGNAKSAVGAFGFVELYADKGDTAEKAVQRAERAKKTTEDTEDENACHGDDHEQGKLPSKQRSERAEQGFVGFVDEQEYPALERTCGADIFTEPGDKEDQRHDDDEEDQHEVFEIGQNPRRAALFELGRFDLV